MRQCNNLAELSNDDSSDDKGDGTIRKICKIPWLEMTEKCGYWVQSEIWDEYICLKGYEKRDISTNDNFFVVFATDHKYQSQISIPLSTRALIYAMTLSTLLNQS